MALGGYSRNFGTGTLSLGEPGGSTLVVAGLGVYLLLWCCRAVRIRKCKETEVGNFEVSEEGWWCSAGSEGEKVEVVMVDDDGNGGQSDERTCKGRLKDLDADDD